MHLGSWVPVLLSLFICAIIVKADVAANGTQSLASPLLPTPPPSPPLLVIRDYLFDLLLIHGVLVFFMQVGFVSLELGYGRSKNVRNILLKNIVDILLCALAWWAVGYAIENGASSAGFIGGTADQGAFFGDADGYTQRPWFFSFTFALATVSIVSGCLAERTNLIVYPILTILMSMWIHPVCAFWAWNSFSWLQHVSKCQFLDFAGGTVVHVVGGCMGLVGAAMCGPRLGRFEDGKPKAMPGHDVSQVAMGTIFLWFGWFGFNCGSLYTEPGVYHMTDTGQRVDGIALNMTLAAAGGGLTVLFITSLRSGTFDLCLCCNGVMVGLVAATPSCAYLAPWASLVTGTLAGVAYLGCSRLLLYLCIDDPLDSTAIHACGGLLGTLMNGIFARPEYVKALLNSQCGGLIYRQDGGLQFGMQVLGVVVCAAWSIFFSVLLFLPLKLLGYLRVDQTTELAGIDNMEHGGPAYPEWRSDMNNPSN